MSLEYNLYHSSSYSASAVLISCCRIRISQSAVNCFLTFRFVTELFRIDKR